MEYRCDEHRVHPIDFRLVRCPERRKAALTGEVAQDGRTPIAAECEGQGWTAVGLAIQPDHVHLFVRAWPSDSASEIVEHCQGVTSHALRLDHPHLKKLPAL